jgi:hypothetical protein
VTISKKLIFALIVLLSAGGHRAYAGSGGSDYSLIGIGDIRYTPGARAAGMGYTGIGLASPQYVNGLSPATWSTINRTRLEATVLYEGFNSSDGDRSRYLAHGNFYGALFAIPISPTNGIVLAGGFLPYSHVDYDTYTSDTFVSGTDTLDSQVHHVGTGGLNKAEVGLSWAPMPNIAIGASLNYLYGTLTNSLDQTTTTPGAAGGTVNNEQTMNGVNYTVGVLYTGLGTLSGALSPFSLGVVVTTRSNLHTTNQTNYLYTFEVDTTSQGVGRLAIPFSYGIGIGYQPGERWALAADYTAQPWGEADFQGSTPAGMIRDSYRLGAGVERTGARENTAAWLDRISYRLGFTYNQTYYVPNGVPINEWGVTAGMAFPLSGETRLNVAAEYASRGTTDNGLIKEKIFRLTLSLNISDLWFVRYEED